MSRSDDQAWVMRCAAELSALIPFFAPAMYGEVSREELIAWAEGLRRSTSSGISAETAAQRALMFMARPFDRRAEAPGTRAP